MKRLLMLICVAAVSSTAAPAYADPPSDPSDKDATFLNDLKTEGVSFKDPTAAITVAKDVCDLVDKGTPDTEIVKNLEAQNPQFTGNGAAKFTLVAAASYCPKYLTGEGRPPKPTGAPGN
jgi:Protein of unknown function (DUF732)